MLSPLLSWVLSFLFSSILDLRFLNPPLRLVFVVCVSPLSPSCRVRDFRLCFFLSRGFSTGRLAWMSFLFLSFRPFASIYKYPYIHISKIVSSLSALGTRTSPCLFHISHSTSSYLPVPPSFTTFSPLRRRYRIHDYTGSVCRVRIVSWCCIRIISLSKGHSTFSNIHSYIDGICICICTIVCIPVTRCRWRRLVVAVSALTVEAGKFGI